MPPLVGCEPDEDEFLNLLQSEVGSEVWRAASALTGSEAVPTRLADVGFGRLSQQEVALVPDCVHKALQGVALTSIRRVFGHNLRSLRYGNIKQLHRNAHKPILKAAYTASEACPHLSKWPLPFLEELFLAGTLLHLKAGETLYARNDSSYFGIILSGECEVRDERGVVSRIEAPCVAMPTKAALSKSLCAKNVVCVGAVEVLDMSMFAALNLRAKLPPECRTSTNIFEDVLLLKPEDRKLRAMVVLSDVRPDCYTHLKAAMTTVTYKQGDILCTAGQSFDALLLLQSGHVAVTAVNPKSIVQDVVYDSSNTSCFAEVEFMYAEETPFTLQVRSQSCVLFVIKRGDFFRSFDAESLELVQKNALKYRMDRAIRLQQMRGGEVERLWLEKLPFAGAIGQTCAIELLRALRLRVVRPGELIASCVAICDRILLITGEAVFRCSGKRIPCSPFEIVGLTCFAQHRWVYTMIATSHCNVWELSRTKALQLLRHQNAIRPVLSWMDTLLKTAVSRDQGVFAYPSPDMSDYRDRLLSHRAPMFQKNWVEPHVDESESEQKKVQKSVTKSVPSTTTQLTERLTKICEPYEAKEVFPEFEMIPILEPEGLTAKSVIYKNPWKVLGMTKKNSLIDSMYKDQLGEVESSGSDGEEEEVFTEVEKQRVFLAKFLATPIPHREMPPRVVEDHHRAPTRRPVMRFKHTHKAASPSTHRTTFIAPTPPTVETPPELTKRRGNCRKGKAGVAGKYINGVFMWQFMSPSPEGSVISKPESRRGGTSAGHSTLDETALFQFDIPEFPMKRKREEKKTALLNVPGGRKKTIMSDGANSGGVTRRKKTMVGKSLSLMTGSEGSNYLDIGD